VSASFTLPFDTREVWGKAKVPVKVTINGHTWRSTVGNRGGIQFIVVNADARLHAGVKAGDAVMIILQVFLSSGLAVVWLLAPIGAIGLGIGVLAFSTDSKVAGTIYVLTNIPSSLTGDS
jgi:hypothetical protein